MLKEKSSTWKLFRNMLNAATFAEWLSVTIARTLKLASANVQTHFSGCSGIHVPFSLVSGEALTTMGKVFCKPQTIKTTMPLYKFPSLSAPIYLSPEYCTFFRKYISSAIKIMSSEIALFSRSTCAALIESTELDLSLANKLNEAMENIPVKFCMIAERCSEEAITV